jgi:CheY-like chemotaxis protein
MVEDNPVNQRVAQMQLAKLGYAADLAAGGAEALQALTERTYDLIFMDCQMPGMDGFEATAEIRKREGGERRVPIVAMTANALEGDRKKCLAAGMDDYLSKPVDLKKLTDILLRWDVTLDVAVIQSLRTLAGDETKLFRDVIEQFLKDSPKRVEAILQAAKDGNARELEKASHALKGASGNIGAKAMWAVCEKIEDLARTNELKEASGPLGVLREEFDKLKADLEKEKEK